MRIAITGASGWLGRAAIATLLSKFGTDTVEILAFGRTRKNIRIDEVEIEILPIDELHAIQDVRIFIHLAFKTRDKLAETSISEYARENRLLTELAASYIRNQRPKSVVTISSGAVFNAPNFNKTADSLEDNPYGFLKIEEEKKLQTECVVAGANLVINRLWGLSGRDVQNPKPFALFDFIDKALRNIPIEINSSYQVWRRYVDARELMELCISIALGGESLIFDSGGPKIEIGELANLVVATLQSSSTVSRSQLTDSNQGDFYYSQSTRYEELFRAYLAREPANIRSQILESSKYLSATSF